MVNPMSPPNDDARKTITDDLYESLERSLSGSFEESEMPKKSSKSKTCWGKSWRVIKYTPLLALRTLKLVFYKVIALILTIAKCIFDLLTAYYLTSASKSIANFIEYIHLRGAHEESKICNVLRKISAGDAFISCARNIGKMEDISKNQEQIKTKIDEMILQIRNIISENSKGRVRLTHVNDPKSMEAVYNRNFDTTIMNGVCFGATLDLFAEMQSLIVKNPGMTHEQALKQVARDREKGIPIRGPAIQALFSLLNISGRQEQIEQAFDVSMAHLGPHQIYQLLLGGIVGLELDSNFDVSHDSCNGPSSTRQHLEHVDFNNFEDGTYQVIFSTGDGAHSIGYVKEGDKWFFFDPNDATLAGHKLEGIHGKSSADSLLYILSNYPVPKEQKGTQRSEANYEVQFAKYVPLGL